MHAYDECTADPSPKPEPEGCHDDRDIVEPLVDVVKHREAEGCNVMKHADARDKNHQQNHAQYKSIFYRFHWIFPSEVFGRYCYCSL